METIHLVGAEQVSSAGHNMNHAAADMKRAADTIEHTLFQHQQFMTQWLADFQTILEQHPTKGETP